ncbi:MAG: hypothetical protein KatS3mg077_0007 [Candidatus Binatia bacterium]|nr:MAG: hypothetical protein KatS3mg077_0007 [Candidatus Binatia bacterium]
MNVFDLHERVLTDYRDFVRSFFLIADERARTFVARTLDVEKHPWSHRQTWTLRPQPEGFSWGISL